MCGEYPVLLDMQQVGKAEVKQIGLYYQIICRCCFPEEGPYIVYAICGTDTRSLGLCVPYEGCFGLTTRLPMKSFTQKPMQFIARKNQAPFKETFIPVQESEPFPELSLLDFARYCRSKGRPGVVINPD